MSKSTKIRHLRRQDQSLTDQILDWIAHIIIALMLGAAISVLSSYAWAGIIAPTLRLFNIWTIYDPEMVIVNAILTELMIGVIAFAACLVLLRRRNRRIRSAIKNSDETTP